MGPPSANGANQRAEALTGYHIRRNPEDRTGVIFLPSATRQNRPIGHALCRNCCSGERLWSKTRREHQAELRATRERGHLEPPSICLSGAGLADSRSAHSQTASWLLGRRGETLRGGL